MIIKYKRFTCYKDSLRIIDACIDYNDNNDAKYTYFESYVKPNSKHKTILYYFDYCWHECISIETTNNDRIIYITKDCIYVRIPNNPLKKFDLNFDLID